MHEIRDTKHRYIRTSNGFFATQVREEFNSLDAHIKQQIYLLSTIDKDFTCEAVERFEKERVECWSDVRRSGGTQVESSELKTEGDQVKTADHSEQQASKLGVSSGDAKDTIEPLVLREAKKAVTDYTKVCEEHIRDYCTDSWSMLSGGLETIDCDYKKTRNIVKKAIEVADNNAEDESKESGKKKAEERRKKLREVWQDAREVWIGAWNEEFHDFDLQEERHMGFLV
ncbi:hypothetical protein FHL15_008000 [Xylaria flabelliformis]|uniref:Uncharacterized protein n=1 Tax=Xylaria flabelliformis TaxID=2512241 RepID=A0A553HSU1_9PEZI|nr:hypothetical protein FHL15_008000 [Xylaria flabelliformis]